MVGVEPTASKSRTWRATKLRYTPGIRALGALAVPSVYAARSAIGSETNGSDALARVQRPLATDWWPEGNVPLGRSGA